MNEPRRQCQSKVDWLQTDVDCSGGQWCQKTAPKDNIETNTNSPLPVINSVQGRLEAELDESITDCQPCSSCKESVFSGESNSHYSEESDLLDDTLPHSYVALDNSNIAGGCVVTATQENENDEQTQPDDNHDEFSNDNSIVDAVIQLASVEREL